MKRKIHLLSSGRATNLFALLSKGWPASEEALLPDYLSSELLNVYGIPLFNAVSS
jgi:hypothetical protein